MRTIFLTLFYGFILTSCLNSQENENPSVENKTDSIVKFKQIPEFEISFPETEFEVTKKVTNSPNIPTITNWILEGKDENGPFLYFVAHNKLPKDLENLILRDTLQREIAFRAMLTGSAEKLGGFDFQYLKTDYKGNPGMISTCKVFKGQGIIKSIVYLIDKDIFVISGGGKGINSETLNAFLASFELSVKD